MNREPSASSDSLLGAVIDKRFRILQYLGSGGVGHVYVAEGLRDGTRGKPAYTVKVLRAEHRLNDKLLARFAREVSAACRVDDPRVLHIFDYGALPEGSPYFVAELLTGMDLADTLAFSRTLAPARAVRIAFDTAHALAAAHGCGVIHRDVKPENIFLVHAPDGRELVKLLDFGSAWIEGDPGGRGAFRLTTRRSAVGTPEYMPPEQAVGDLAEPSADVYALGIVLFEMLTGRPPFVGSAPLVTEAHAVEKPPPMRAVAPDLEVSADLEMVVMKALAKAPSHRWSSALEMASALAACREGRGLG
jgi:serine/threonine-protein kinase